MKLIPSSNQIMLLGFIVNPLEFNQLNKD